MHSILYLPFSFIQQLILTDSPLSVIWWHALFCLTSCWVALLCTKTVKIILWALYLQPTLKSYSLSSLSLVRSAWVGKGLEQNTLTYWATCFHFTLRTTQTLRTYSLNFWVKSFKGHGWGTLWNVFLWFGPSHTKHSQRFNGLILNCYKGYTGKWLC